MRSIGIVLTILLIHLQCIIISVSSILPSPLDLQMVFQGMKNGSTVYVDDVENNGWSISIYPHQNNDVRLLVKKNGKFLKNYRKGTRYVDSTIGMHHIEAIAVFQTHVVRRQLYYTILSRERGLTEWGIPPYTPRGFVPSIYVDEWLLSGTLYLQLLLPKCIFKTQKKFPIIAYLRNKTTMELLPVPLDINFNRGNDEMIFEMSFFRGMASALVPIPLSIASSATSTSIGLRFFRNNNLFGETELEFCNMHYKLPKYEFLNSYDGLDTNVHFPANIILSNINVNHNDNNIDIETEAYGIDDDHDDDDDDVEDEAEKTNAVLNNQKNDIYITNNAEVTICGGSIVLLKEDTNIYINSGGKLRIEKCEGVAISTIFMSQSKSKAWGGIVIEGINSYLYAVHTIFYGSGGGGGSNLNFGLGHRKEVSLLSIHADAKVDLSHSQLIYGAGQAIVASSGATLNANFSLIQGFTCGLQCSNATITISNSIFTDFPTRFFNNNDDDKLLIEYKDSDHDAMYIVGGNVNILKSAVGNAMDDCIDSGTGPGGNLTIRDTYIESCYHEGIALSDNGFDIPKTVRIEHVIVEDCQQGIELGFSTHLHTISVKNVLFYSNYVGLRIGDNYGWQVDGMLACNECVFSGNTIGILDRHALQFGPLRHNLIIQNSLLQPDDAYGSLYGMNVKFAVLEIQKIQLGHWMKPHLRTIYDFILDKKYICKEKGTDDILWMEIIECNNDKSEVEQATERNYKCFMNHIDMVTLRLSVKYKVDEKLEEIYLPFCIPDELYTPDQRRSQFYLPLKAKWAVKTFCQQYGCTKNEIDILQKQLMNLIPKSSLLYQLQQENTLPSTTEYHTFIIFSNVHENIHDDIASLLSKLDKFSSLKLISRNTMQHYSGTFDEEWYKLFYGEKYYFIYDASRKQQLMIDHKGSSTFTWFVIEDKRPMYQYVDKKGYVNQNIYELKYGLRRWVSNRFSLHTSQTFLEGRADMELFIPDHALLARFINNETKKNTDNNLAPHQWIYIDVFHSAGMLISTYEVIQTIARSEIYNVHLDVKQVEKEMIETLYNVNHSDFVSVEHSTLIGGIILGQTRFPIIAHTPSTTKWYKVAVAVKDLGEMMIINAKSWWLIGRKCSTVSDLALKYNNANEKIGEHFSKIYEMNKKKYHIEPVITAVTSDWKHYTLYDGNHRGVYFYLNMHPNSKIQVLVGHTSDFTRQYQGNFYCLQKYEPAWPFEE